MSIWRAIRTGIGERGARALVRLALAAGVCYLLAGCDADRTDDRLRMGLASAPRNLDPRYATDATSERINRLLYRRLVEFDEASLPVPSLAHWIRISPTRYRFVLGAEGREFTDGTRLDAADVAATYASILDPANASPHRALLSTIEYIQTDGPDRIEFRIARADPLFPAYLGIGILPEALIRKGHEFQREPVGSGPFRFLAWPEPGRLLLRRRHDDTELEFVTVKDPNVRVMKLLRGEIQMLQNDLSPELVGFLRERDRMQVRDIAGANFSYLGFNLEDPVTGQLQVRRAIAHALDRRAILRYLFRGAGRTAEAMFPPDHWAGATGLAGYSHDPARARYLLAAAGFGRERPLKLVFKTSSDPFRLRLATVLQAQLADVGIELDVRSYDWGTLYGDIKAGRFQVYSLTWVGVRTPDIFRYVFHSASVPPNGANRGRYRNPLADRLIDRARTEQDLTRQAEIYGELQALLHRELPYIPLWYENQIFASRKEVKGYRLAPDGNYDGLVDVEIQSEETATPTRRPLARSWPMPPSTPEKAARHDHTMW